MIKAMSRILNYGSLNIDEVLTVPHFVRPGETLGVPSSARYAGGKGLNQAVALARAGAKVWFAGAIGKDGGFLKDVLRDSGADVSLVRETELPTGRAIIQVDETGQNSILIIRGANGSFSPSHAKDALSRFAPGDWLLVENETAGTDFLISEGHSRGLLVAFNPSPMDERVLSYPLGFVDCLFVNETEAEALTSKTSPEAMLSALRQKLPNARIVLTLGGDGCLYADAAETFRVPAFSVPVVDTTGAGDTFTGYFLAALAEGRQARYAAELASRAASITVSRPGASASIPFRAEAE